MAILKNMGGDTDIFGKSYGLPASTTGADAYGNSRPFQTEPSITRIAGTGYFNVPAIIGSTTAGRLMNLINSPSYPSGHTTYGYAGALLLAVLVPERYQQMITRGAEYGNDRILIGAHYAMDVMGGRMLAIYDLAHLLANDPAYVGQSLKDATSIKDFQAAMRGGTRRPDHDPAGCMRPDHSRSAPAKTPAASTTPRPTKPSMLPRKPTIYRSSIPETPIRWRTSASLLPRPDTC